MAPPWRNAFLFLSLVARHQDAHPGTACARHRNGRSRAAPERIRNGVPHTNVCSMDRAILTAGRKMDALDGVVDAGGLYRRGHRRGSDIFVDAKPGIGKPESVDGPSAERGDHSGISRSAPRERYEGRTFLFPV